MVIRDSGENKPKEEFQEGISTVLGPLDKRTAVHVLITQDAFSKYAD